MSTSQKKYSRGIGSTVRKNPMNRNCCQLQIMYFSPNFSSGQPKGRQCWWCISCAPNRIKPGGNRWEPHNLGTYTPNIHRHRLSDPFEYHIKQKRPQPHIQYITNADKLCGNTTTWANLHQQHTNRLRLLDPFEHLVRQQDQSYPIM